MLHHSLIILLLALSLQACATVKRTCHAACDQIPDEKTVAEETAQTLMECN